MSAIPVFGKWRQEDHEFEASLGYIVRTLSQKKLFFKASHVANERWIKWVNMQKVPRTVLNV
jgi:hypothetical protein